MTRRSHRRTIVVVAVLALSVLSATSQAAYLTTIGPARCCATHCRHHASPRDAERCCKTHLTVAPATATKAATVTAAVLTSAAPVQLALLPRLTIAAASRLEGRAPPDTSLVAQHSSLLV